MGKIVRATTAVCRNPVNQLITLFIFLIKNKTRRKIHLKINFLFSVRIIADIPEVSAASSSSTTAATNNVSTVKTKITAPSPTNNGTGSNALSRNLWVSGLSSLTRATDLKLIFSKFGKVIGAKVVTNTRTPGQRCFGYVTMANAKDATECIGNLHRTELHGRMISVERAKGDLGPPKLNSNAASTAAKPSETKVNPSNNTSSDKKKDSESTKKSISSKDAKDSDRKDSRKTTTDDKSKDKKKDESKTTSSGASSTTAKPERKRISPPRSDSKSKAKSKDRQVDRVADKPRPVRSNSATKKERDVLSYNKAREAREARDRKRLKDKERELMEEDRRRREIRRRQREEEQRLIREREKLAVERRRIEEQKAELLRIERERQKLERDKIELERLELKRQQRKYG